MQVSLEPLWAQRSFALPWHPRNAWLQRLFSVSSTPGCFDRGYIDLLHFHHRLERALGYSASGGHRSREHTRSDLPGHPPPVLAPSTGALLTAVAYNGVPVSVGLLSSPLSIDSIANPAQTSEPRSSRLTRWRWNPRAKGPAPSQPGVTTPGKYPHTLRAESPHRHAPSSPILAKPSSMKVVFWMRASLAYRPPSATSWSCVPRSTISPCFNTRI